MIQYGSLFVILFEYEELGDQVVRNCGNSWREQEYNIVVPAQSFIEDTVDRFIHEEGRDPSTTELDVFVQDLFIIVFEDPGPVGKKRKRCTDDPRQGNTEVAVHVQNLDEQCPCDKADDRRTSA